MTEAKKRVICDLLDNWDRAAEPETTDDVEAAASNVVSVLGRIVTTYGYGHDEIEILLTEAFTRTILKGRQRGRDLGREFERANNPALKSAGECVKVARAGERFALRSTLRTVFDAETTRGTNPFYAFNEALKAVE